jgi:hypothetical protein
MSDETFIWEVLPDGPMMRAMKVRYGAAERQGEPITTIYAELKHLFDADADAITDFSQMVAEQVHGIYGGSVPSFRSFIAVAILHGVMLGSVAQAQYELETRDAIADLPETGRDA